MGLREVGGLPGAPWQRELRGTFHELVLESEVLTGNPLGDPARRPLYVYLPPGVERGGDGSHPSIYLLQGMTGQLDEWLNRKPFEPTMPERCDELFSSGQSPPAVVVFVDAWTSYGGSQFINSTSTGRYMDYLCDEVVPFVDAHFPTADERDRRAVSGHSSGGYGAMVNSMLRPDVFGAFGSHAGDALFEVCYLPSFPAAARALRDRFDGSVEKFWERVHARASDRFEWDLFWEFYELYAYAACYSPDKSNPGRAIVPIDIETARLIDEVWEQWLAWDPVRMAPRHADALASMRGIYLDGGRSDEWYLDLGAQAFAKELRKLDVDHSLELFDGKHGGVQYRYPMALKFLAETLAR